MNEETQASGPQDGAIACRASSHEREHAEWKRRQALQPSAGTWLSPTLPERINRLRPSERHEVQALIKSLKLRKIVRRTLAEAFWARETQTAAQELYEDPRFYGHSMQRLRATVRAHESLTNYERALTSFEPVIEPIAKSKIEVT